MFVLTRRDLPVTRDTVVLHAGDLAEFLNGDLRQRFRSIWVVGGGTLAGEILRHGLVDEVRYAILPVLIGTGIPFFAGLERDVALHLIEAKPYSNGMVELAYEVRRNPEAGNTDAT